MNAADLGRDLRIIVAGARVGRLQRAGFRLRPVGLGALCLGSVGLWGCGSEPSLGESADVSEAGTATGDDTETDAPEPNVEGFDVAYAVMKTSCSECHKVGTGHSFLVGSSAELTLPSALAAKDKIAMRITASVASERMPPEKPLSAEELATLQAWLSTL